MLQSSKHIQRAYLYIDVDTFSAETGPFHIKKILEELEKLKNLPIKNLSGKAKLVLYNEGHTPAYPILYGASVVPYSLTEFNIPDSLLKCESFTFTPGIELPSVIVQNHNFAWVKTFKNLSTDEEGHLFIHTYFLYKDVFGDYHDIYTVFEYAIDVKRGGAFGFPPLVNIDIFTQDEFATILTKVKYDGQKPEEDVKPQ